MYQGRYKQYQIAVILLVLQLLFAVVNGQDNRILLLYGKSDLFLPEIESCLRRLSNSDSEHALFSKVQNLNLYFMNREQTTELDRLIRYYESDLNLRTKSKAGHEMDSIFQNLIAGASSYMSVDVNQASSLFEIRALITDSMRQIEPQHYPALITQNSRYMSFYVTTEAGSIGSQIDYGLRHLFPKSNHPPNPVISDGQKSLFCGDTLYASLGTQVNLNASRSTDPDDPMEHLTFQWNIMGPYQISADSTSILPSQILSAGPQITIESNSPAIYEVELMASDGISMGKSGTACILFAHKPMILHETSYRISRYLFQRTNYVDIFVDDPSELGVTPIIASAIRTPERSGTQLLKFPKKPIIPQDVISHFNIICMGEVDSNLHRYHYRIVGDFEDDSKYSIALCSSTDSPAVDSTRFQVIHKNMAFRNPLRPRFARYGGNLPSEPDSDLSWSEYSISVTWGLEFGLTRWLSFEYGMCFASRLDKAEDRPHFCRSNFNYYRITLEDMYSIGVHQAGRYWGISQGLNIGKAFSDIPISYEFTWFERGWKEISLSLNSDISEELTVLLVIASYLIPFFAE